MILQSGVSTPALCRAAGAGAGQLRSTAGCGGPTPRKASRRAGRAEARAARWGAAERWGRLVLPEVGRDATCPPQFHPIPAPPVPHRPDGAVRPGPPLLRPGNPEVLRAAFAEAALENADSSQQGCPAPKRAVLVLDPLEKKRRCPEQVGRCYGEACLLLNAW